MKGNLNPFSGDRLYQTTHLLQFLLPKTEESFLQDFSSRNRSSILILSLLSLLLITLSYFLNTCNIPTSSECTHQFLLILSLISTFISSILITRARPSKPWVFSLLAILTSLYPNIKLMESNEQGTIVLIVSYMTVQAYFLLNTWKKALLYEIAGFLSIFIYAYLTEELFMLQKLKSDYWTLIPAIITSIILLAANERVLKEKWVLYDSFKKSERMMEFLIEELPFPIYLIGPTGFILLHNASARALLPSAPPVRVRKLLPGFNQTLSDLSLKELEPLERLLAEEGEHKALLTIRHGVNMELEELFEAVSKAFVWKGLKCKVLVLKEESLIQLEEKLEDYTARKTLETIMGLINSQYLEEQNYYDSLLQNESLMQNNKRIYQKLHRCHSLLFLTVVARNLIINDFQKIVLEPKELFHRNFFPSDLLITLQRALSCSAEKRQVVIDLATWDYDRNLSNNSLKSGLLRVNSDRKNQSSGNYNPNPNIISDQRSKNDKLLKLLGPEDLLKHFLSIVVLSVLKLGLCRKVSFAFKLERPEENLDEEQDEPIYLYMEIAFEEENEPFLSNHTSSILVGDLLSSFKEKHNIHDHLNEICNLPQNYTPLQLKEACLNSFSEQERNKNLCLGVFLTPFLLQTLQTKAEISQDEDIDKRITRVLVKVPVLKAKENALVTEKKPTAVFVEKKGLFTEKDKVEIADKNTKKKKPVLTLVNKVFEMEFLPKNQNKMEFLPKNQNNNEQEERKEGIFSLIPKTISKDYVPKPTESFNKLNTLEIDLKNNKKHNNNDYNSSLVNNSNSLNNIKRTEIYIDEELKKHIHHLQNGFTATLESLLDTLLNDEASKDAHLIFPPKSQIFSSPNPINEKSPKTNFISKSFKHRRSLLHKHNHEEHDDVSSFLFTESNKTDSALTVNNDDDMLPNESSERNTLSSLKLLAESSKTFSNKINPRSFDQNNNTALFCSPSLLRAVPEEKHVLVRNDLLVKYLKKKSLIEKEETKESLIKSSHAPNINEKDKKQRKSDAFKKKNRRKIDIKNLTYTRKWATIHKKGIPTVITEVSCATFNQLDRNNQDIYPKIGEEDSKKVFYRKPTSKNKSINMEKGNSEYKSHNVLTKIKEIAHIDRLERFPNENYEELKQEDRKKGPKSLKYEFIMSSLSYKEKPTILAFDSDPLINDPGRCKGIKSLALKIGHDYKFELRSTGLEVLKGYKAFLRRSSMFHLILIEMEMAGLEAWKFVRKIRDFEAKHQFREKSFIVCLLNEDQRDYELYVRWGLDEFLRKPFEKHLFEEILKRRVEAIHTEQKEDNKIENNKTEINANKIELEGFKGIEKEGKLAVYRKEPLLLLTIDDNPYILMGMSHLKLKV